MDWPQFATFLVIIAGLFLWNRAEARADSRHANNLIEAMKNDIKDFHAKSSVLEERFYNFLMNKKGK